MNEDFLNKGIGIIEQESLQPADIQVQGVRLIDVFKKGSTVEVAGQKIGLICKHPEKDETIELSNVKLLLNDSLKVITLWYNLDKDGNLSKSSATALLLKYYNVETYNDLIGKTLNTVTQSENNKYLCVKAY